MSVVTRFAPSPTGFLHIGGARTALFNWLFSHHHGGRFLLRVEDTDRERSTQEAIDAIANGLSWLGLQWEGEPYFQSAHQDRHVEVANLLLEQGHAYLCYCTPEELAAMREEAQKTGKAFRYDGRWRDRDPKEAPEGVAPAIRLKAPQEGDTVIEDAVQGRVSVPNNELDDMILLRSDGTPTYMLAVVVDDHDMGITHVIRGDDHLTNTFRQALIYHALGWELPTFAHIPLIHGPDGAKLSKRHGALGIEAYRDMGYLPEALRNYLLRLGWSHGDDEIISTEQAIAWFSLDNVGKSPARFDMDKLNNINAHYLRECDEAALMEALQPFLPEVEETALGRIRAGLGGLKERAKTLKELAEAAAIYIARQEYDEKAAQLITQDETQQVISDISERLASVDAWEKEALEKIVKDYAEARELKLGKIAPPLRAALTGRMSSPGIFEVMVILGKEETLERLKSLG